MFFFAVWGGLETWSLNYSGPDATISAAWGDSFQLPSSPAGDYFAISSFGNSPQSGDITINGHSGYVFVGSIEFSPGVYPDPNLPNEILGGPLTVYQRISDPLLIQAFGSWQITLDPSSCCVPDQPNLYLFEQMMQIERFHADGTPDPWQAVPEPASWALMGIGGLLCLLHLRRRHKVSVESAELW